MKDQAYLLVADYFSRYIEISRSTLLSFQTSFGTIRALKSIFSRHGVHEITRSNNEAQYISTEFVNFAKDWNFEHIISSPKHLQSNGEAVQTMKNMLKKEQDPSAALLNNNK